MTQPAEGGSSNSTESSDVELEAIQALLAALSNLQDDARQRVIAYVFQRLGLKQPDQRPMGTLVDAAQTPVVISAGLPTDGPALQDIRSLKDRKKPRSAVEMAVLVAYYLAESAPEGMRKSSIGTEDLNAYFKQAGYPLPSVPRNVLSGAKAAGYLDSDAHGKYKLNPVGHNLVAHALPSGDGAGTTRPASKKTGRKGSK